MPDGSEKPDLHSELNELIEKTCREMMKEWWREYYAAWEKLRVRQMAELEKNFWRANSALGIDHWVLPTVIVDKTHEPA